MIKFLQGDCIEVLPALEARSVQCCVTSPPYWGLRDYGCEAQIGLESTPEQYVANMVRVFREVWRVLRDDGTLWLNLGSSYASNPASGGQQSPLMTGGEHKRTPQINGYHRPVGFKPKDLVPIPWMVAMSLQADGWYLRSDIIWAKPNPMPESVTDRPTKSHEYIFLLTKSSKYFYDGEAIREPNFSPVRVREKGDGESAVDTKMRGFGSHCGTYAAGHNKRTVWNVATQSYCEAHFATFPEDLIKPCILAGSRLGDTVLDPFAGSGTTGKVAIELGRSAILIELNPVYVAMIEQRTNVTPGML